MQTTVQITRQARKGLEKAPGYIQDKFFVWVSSVQQFGLETARQVPAYHDEPLQGKRKTQRSIRLNKQWRAIYKETANHEILVTVMEVTPHDYRIS
jgi:proteic killer suppression protein